MHVRLVFLAVMVGGWVLAASPANADQPVHVKFTVGPSVFDAPAGTVCDFNYHQEFTITRNAKRFFDDQGKLVRIERQDDGFVLHQNVDTGLTLTERAHTSFHFDLITLELRVTGNWWHLRDADGSIVLVGSGAYQVDLVTGEIIDETPHVGANFASTICPALGGAPAR